MMRQHAWGFALDSVRTNAPLIHCITNYVTVNDCANVLIACGGSPVMSDEPEDVEDIARICDALVINIGTLNARTIEAIGRAGREAARQGRPIVLDPVGAGASELRTSTAARLLDELPVTVLRGNMSEMRALAGAASATRGVDVNQADVVSEGTLVESAAFAQSLASKTGALVVITGAIDLISDAHETYAVRNGSPLMGKITGSGCMLTCLLAAAVAANPDRKLDALVAMVCGYALAGEDASLRMGERDGNASYRTYLIDAVFSLTGERLGRGAAIEAVCA